MNLLNFSLCLCLCQGINAFKNIPLTIKCTKGLSGNEKNLTVFGSHVKFSDFLNDSVFSRNVWKDSCNATNVKVLQVFSNNIMEIDKELQATGLQLHVSLIAPIWLTHAKIQKISLNGKDAPNPSSENIDGKIPGADGSNGEAGKAGGDAGNFLGIYLEHRDSLQSSLEIHGFGGKGGRGQNGGNGISGLPGQPAQTENLPSSPYDNYINLDSYPVDMDLLQPGGLYKGCIEYEEIQPCNYRHQWYTKMGDEGGPGGNGGNGGNGGHGGLGGGGNMLLIDLSKEILRNTFSCNKWNIDNITVYCHDGPAGEPGEGGQGGTGGYYGDHLSCPYWGGSYDEYDCKRTVSFREASSGRKGLVGGTVVRPHVHKTLGPHILNDINRYKEIFFDDRLANETFVTKIDVSPDILFISTPLSIAKDISNIEEQYFNKQSNNNNGYLHLLERQLTKIKRFTSRAKAKGKLSPEDNLALNYIFASVISQMSSIEESEDIVNVISPGLYFSHIVNTFSHINEARAFRNAFEQKRRYKTDLDEKIQGVSELIQTVVQPALKEAEKLLENQTQIMLREMEEILEGAEEKVEHAKGQKALHESLYAQRILLGGLKVVATAASLFGVAGKVASGIITTGVNAYEGYVRNDEPTPEFPDIALDFAEIGGDVKDAIDGKLKSSVAALDEAKKLYNDNQQFLEDLKPKIVEFEEKITVLKTIKETGIIPDILQGELELDQVTGKLEEAIGEKQKLSTGEQNAFAKIPEHETAVSEASAKVKSASKWDSEKISNAIAHVATVFKLAKGGFDFINVFKAHNRKSQRFEAMINEATENVRRAENMRLSMYNKLVPMMTTVSKGLDKGLEGNSKAALNVKQWQIKSSLADLKRTMSTYTENMKIGEELKLCIDKIQEAVLLLIKLYEVIDHYDEKKEFADYIGNIMSSSTLTSTIKDPELASEINKMRLTVLRSTFHEKFNHAIHTFKKWIFPFAKHYLDEHLNFTGSVSTNSSIESMTDLYQEKVSKLHLYLQQYNATTSGRDEVLLVSNFSSFSLGSVPFFTWKSQHWHMSIKNFFAGKPIQLFASLDNRATRNGKSAIKFRTIAFMVRAKNKQGQPEVDNLLGHFQVKYTHSGNSHYYLGGKEYIIYDKNVTYINSFERSGNSFTTSNYALAKQAEKGDFLLSPYTMWTVQLIDALPLEGLTFNDLESLSQKVDLTLEGTGLYVDECLLGKRFISRLQVQSHYEPIEGKSTILTPCLFY